MRMQRLFQRGKAGRADGNCRAIYDRRDGGHPRTSYRSRHLLRLEQTLLAEQGGLDVCFDASSMASRARKWWDFWTLQEASMTCHIRTAKASSGCACSLDVTVSYTQSRDSRQINLSSDNRDAEWLDV